MSIKVVGDFTVLKNNSINPTNFYLQLKAHSPLPDILPGQFVNVEIPKTKEVFLRRPFSVYEVDYRLNTISLLVKVLGRGSKVLTEIREGEILNLIYPLGRGFTLPLKTDKILLVGGGSGVAPVLFLSKICGISNENVDIILGVKTKSEHINVREYAVYGNIQYSTDDGTLGTKGFVTQHPFFANLRNYSRIYACGPLGMMKAVAIEAGKAGISCEVSLENLMACGFGVCLCCIEPTVNGNLCICTEGPVFNTNELKWQI